ncbi:adenine phosphoribosyltransferase-like [Saccoglossus kowalevskii]|uniref:adenine phosphoribosyltransferase n=1 Tax=Saccoglossus kowalevskii TaxID=10224 RepID=A0ABM0GKT1_SACKO|nr:PREDICTED: adenine phosphoribosyltransferase-like [Saccoglossus kowalevskii]
MGTTKDKYWYWSLVAPNVKGPGFAWLDPSRLYANREAFRGCVIDLLEPFDTNEIDLVAGIDAMGFILGSSIANYLDKGFLALRKKGGLCVDTSDVHYTDYQNTKKTLEIRTDPFLEGTRVLLVDQWIETGGTMHAAITLVERMKGIVAGRKK